MAELKSKKLELLLSKVADDKKDEFQKEIIAAGTPEERVAVCKKYAITLTDDEKEFFKAANSGKMSDDELDEVSGGECACSRDEGGRSCSSGCW